MKLISYLFILITSVCYSQGYGEVEYVFVDKIINYKSKAVLKYTPTRSHYILLKSEELTEEVRTVDENGGIQIKVPDVDERPEIYTDRASDTLLKVQYFFSEKYILNEALPKIDWQIQQEFKDLNTIKCQKATGYFRGRTYIAWYVQDIPVPYGPWKLVGLPGLILEAYDVEKSILFKVSKFKTEEKVNDIILPDGKNKMSLKEFWTEEYPKKQEEIATYLKSLNTDRNTTIVSSKSTSPPGLELIYEWEDNYPKNK